MTINFSYEDVVALAGKHRVIPVIQTLFSGSETPLSIFEKLAADKPGSFLLESAEQGVWARYSFIGVRNQRYIPLTANIEPRARERGHRRSRPRPRTGRRLPGRRRRAPSCRRGLALP